MILIVFLWLLSMKTFLASPGNQDMEDSFKLDDLAADFYESMEELSADFKELEEAVEELEASSTEENQVEESEPNNIKEDEQINIDKSTTTENGVLEETPEEVENSAS